LKLPRMKRQATLPTGPAPFLE